MLHFMWNTKDDRYAKGFGKTVEKEQTGWLLTLVVWPAGGRERQIYKSKLYRCSQPLLPELRKKEGVTERVGGWAE